MKKSFALLLTFALLLSALMGCSSNIQSKIPQQDVGGSSDDAETIDTGDMPNLVMLFPYLEIPSDVQKVEDALNEILIEEVGCTVELQATTYGNIADQQTLILSSPSEQLDLLMGFFWGVGLSSYVGKGQFTPMNDLLENHGQGVLENIDSHSLMSCTIEGEVYGILTNRNLAGCSALVFFEDQIAELGLDLPERFTSFSDITPIFAALHEAYPDAYVLGNAPPKTPPFFDINGRIDELSDRLGVLMDMDDLTVTNLFESDYYREFCLAFKEWNDAGYIYTDMLIDSSNAGTTMMRNGILLSCINVSAPGVEADVAIQVGREAVVPALGYPKRTSLQNWSWVIPQNAVYPEKAMEVINVLFTNEEAINLLSYGVEGVHWERNANGFVIDGPESAAYADKKMFATGNGYIAAVVDGAPADLGEQLKEFNASANISSAIGFVFDSDAHTAEYTALTNVLNEYQLMLEWGFVDDVDDMLEKFNEALYAAGLQDYMDAKQAQLDAWAATNS